MDCCKYSASSKNQRVVFYAVVSRSALDRIALKVADVVNRIEEQQKEDIMFRGCPHVVIAYCELKTPWPAQEDGTIALATLDLYAQSKGYGTFWCGYLRNALMERQAIAAELGLGDKQILGCLGLGKPSVPFKRAILRKDIPVDFM